MTNHEIQEKPHQKTPPKNRGCHYIIKDLFYIYKTLT